MANRGQASVYAPLYDFDFYRGDPYPTYEQLRNEAPVYWCEEGSFWALSKYQDIRWVSANPKIFSSMGGVTIADRPIASRSLIHTDPPLHRQLRGLVNKGFTPKQISSLEPIVRGMAVDILDDVKRNEPVDFVEQVASPLPTKVIAELLGAPREDWQTFRRWSDAVVGADDPDSKMGSTDARQALHEYFLRIIGDAVRQHNASGLISVLLSAELEGERLSDEDLYNFCWLLLVAGNETTRNLIAFGALALLEHPDQMSLLRNDAALIPSAIEEMLRWSSPVTHMTRTATEDVTLRGQVIREGERVMMLYGSANRDEDIFGPTADVFHVRRDPNPHVAFGFGEHLCLGASLARLEARVMFEELLERLPDFRLTGEVTRLRSPMVPGVVRMPIVFSSVPALLRL